MTLGRLSKNVRYEEVENQTMAQAAFYLKRLLPNGRVQGHEFVSLNPLRQDNKAGSFKYNLQKHVWADFATGETGRGVVSLCAYLYGLSYRDAAKRLDDFSLPVFPASGYGRTKATKVSKAAMPDDKTAALIKFLWGKTQAAEGTLLVTYLWATLCGCEHPAMTKNLPKKD